MIVVLSLGSSDVYLAYLPLAHVFKLAAENIVVVQAVMLSNKIKKGSLGDTSILKPTLMAAVPAILDCVVPVILDRVVPAILDRVRGGVQKKVKEKGGSPLSTMVPPTLSSMGSLIIAITLRQGKGMDAKHGSKMHD
ncbi:hypothetical protein HHK36_011381 [Tetracentron sinense]|uniref:Uncharacterized protein n=1 Tax=Tetracentron sinense TaxID=13715 RepID=A0A835DKD2_TETSI|nr:hypothetical protein HHK36_011381 [Tetracentron sinense]